MAIDNALHKITSLINDSSAHLALSKTKQRPVCRSAAVWSDHWGCGITARGGAPVRIIKSVLTSIYDAVLQILTCFNANALSLEKD